MKTTMKVAAITSILTMGLATTSWASPRSKLSYDPFGSMSPANYRASSGPSNHVWFKHPGPASKL